MRGPTYPAMFDESTVKRVCRGVGGRRPSAGSSAIAGPAERNRKEDQDMTYYLVMGGIMLGLIVFLVIYRRRQE